LNDRIFRADPDEKNSSVILIVIKVMNRIYRTWIFPFQSNPEKKFTLTQNTNDAYRHDEGDRKRFPCLSGVD